MNARALAVTSLLVAAPAVADEGMWLFNEFPSDAVKKAYGFAPDQKWLDTVRLGSLRLTGSGGCSASLVSSKGLVMTNHHCIRSCLEDLSTPQHDYLTEPFIAATEADELKCPKVEANQLLAITDATEAVTTATKGATGAEYQTKLKAVQSKLESECAGGDAKKRCDLVTLYSGAKFHLYQYRRLQDLRMVFAPEFSTAAFGGDPDNFNFPRYGVDMAFLRLYEDGKPVATPERLPFAKVGAKENDLVFVSGNPGATERLKTVAQLEYARDVGLPWSLLALAELRGRVDEWMKVDPERTRTARSKLRAVENSLKALRGRHDALVAVGFLENKRKAEAELREKAPESTRKAWDDIASAMLVQRTLHRDYRMKEAGEAFSSELFGYARQLVRALDESKQPNEKRLREYTDAQLPAVKMQLLNAAPVPKAFDAALLGWSLARMRNLYGADDPFVRSVLGNKAPEELAKELVDGSKLDDAAYRKAVLEGTQKPDDPMLVFAKKVDAEARAVRKKMEDEVDAVVKKSAEQLAEARRTVLGTSGYPDATFTPRLSFGTVKGWANVKPITTVGGYFSRLTGKAPFAATEPWLKAKASIPPATPFDLCTTNDIIGGNSGSPLVNKSGEVVGLIFDGNLPSLGGNFGYDANENRAVGVHAELMMTALSKVYGAKRVEQELRAR